MDCQQEREHTSPERRLAGEAIDLAMRGSWEEAVAKNKSIIERFPCDAGAYNRLGKALMELGEFARAQEAYGRVLELDPGNSIAAKNLARLSGLPESRVNSGGGCHKISPALFVAEMGKVGIVSLGDLASSEVLAMVSVGTQVHLKVEGHRLLVENESGGYLGQVEPKRGGRLIELVQGGNRYAVAILGAGASGVQVIIREEFQHSSQAGRPSFPANAAEHGFLSTGVHFLRAPAIAGGEKTAMGFDVPGEIEGDKEEKEALMEGFSVVGEIDIGEEDLKSNGS